MFRAGAAAASDDVGACLDPLARVFGEMVGVVLADPAAMLGIPILSAVGVDDHGGSFSRCDFVEQAYDVSGRGAVHADADKEPERPLIHDLGNMTHRMPTAKMSAITT